MNVIINLKRHKLLMEKSRVDPWKKVHVAIPNSVA